MAATHAEVCRICWEAVDCSKMFKIGVCHHRFCFPCMTNHVTLKVGCREVPRCPQSDCRVELDLNTCCRNFLPRTMHDALDQLLKESSIPAKDKVYCPKPRCSNLMSKTEALHSNRISAAANGMAKVELSQGRCVKCNSVFCIDCKVLWHLNLSCGMHKLLEMESGSPDAMLRLLAQRHKWKQCPSCSHMVELAHGCYHMLCRCGHQFCYLCGKEWEDKRDTCSSSCVLWSEENIIHA